MHVTLPPFEVAEVTPNETFLRHTQPLPTCPYVHFVTNGRDLGLQVGDKVTLTLDVADLPPAPPLAIVPEQPPVMPETLCPRNTEA